MDVQAKYQNSLMAITNVIIKEHPDIVGMIVEFQRKRLSDLVRNHHNATVAYGPFKGMRLSPDTHWGAADQGAMVLGLYEQELLKELEGLMPQRSVFVDLGAADGYYGIGVLVGNMCKKSYCFEISEKGREVIAANAEANAVKDRVAILGEASQTFFNEIDETDRGDAVLLVDIEGAEFDVLTPAAFQAFARSTVIVEIHDWVPDSQNKIARLRRQAAATHTVREFSTAARDLSGFGELKMLDDTSRWLLCSEGRPRLMSWYRFDPLPGS